MSIKKLIADKKTKLAEPAPGSSPEPSIPASVRDGGYYLINIEDIRPNPDQPRKFFDEEKLGELVESIRQKGVLQPIIVKPAEDRNLLLVAGERRWRAAKSAGLEQIPCIITTGNADEIGLIENLQRDDLKPLEEAEALQRMVKKYDYTYEQLARIIGKAKSTIGEILSLNRLPEQIKQECRGSSHYSRRLLVEISKQPSERRMMALFAKVKKDVLSSDEVREMVKEKAQERRSKVETVILGAEKLHRDLGRLNPDAMDQAQRALLSPVLSKLRDSIERILKPSFGAPDEKEINPSE
jgi:ParB family chromosome partitioning protein